MSHHHLTGSRGGDRRCPVSGAGLITAGHSARGMLGPVQWQLLLLGPCLAYCHCLVPKCQTLKQSCTAHKSGVPLNINASAGELETVEWPLARPAYLATARPRPSSPPCPPGGPQPLASVTTFRRGEAASAAASRQHRVAPPSPPRPGQRINTHQVH